MESAPAYWQIISGRVIEATGAVGAFEALPEGKTFEDKYVFGVFCEERMVGCVDLIRGFPNPDTAMLGLLLISETHQGRGVGKASYEAVERFVRSWGEIRKVRIGVVAVNTAAMPFWRSLGFVETGVRRPYEDNSVVSENIVFEKCLE